MVTPSLPLRDMEWRVGGRGQRDGEGSGALRPMVDPADGGPGTA